MNSYARKLLDPRWQRKRLEAMKFSGFECEMCGSEQNTLHVHHKLYRKNAAPWDYDVSELAVLCEPCHRQWHQWRDDLNEAIALCDVGSIELLLGSAVLQATYDFPNFDIPVSSQLVIEHLADAYGLHPVEVRAVMENGCVSGVALTMATKQKAERANAESHPA